MNIKVKKFIRNSLSTKEFDFVNRLKSRQMKLIAIIIILLEQNIATQNLNDRKASKLLTKILIVYYLYFHILKFLILNFSHTNMIFLGHSTLAEICGGHINHCFSKLLYYQPKSKRFRFSL